MHDQGRPFDTVGLLDCIDPLDSFVREAADADRGCFAVAYPASSPVSTDRLVELGQLVCLFAGDLVGEQRVPWPDIVQSVTHGSREPAALRNLQGAFAFAMFDTVARKLYLVTDHFGYQPVYVYDSGDRLIVSTSIATFCRMARSTPTVDEKWIWEYLFFNYAAGTRTFLDGVSRLPPGRLVEWDLREEKSSTRRYVECLSRKPLDTSRAAELEQAQVLFRGIVPKWSGSEGGVAFGLSGGLDSRAMLAVLPEESYAQIRSFTYGIPGSTEQVEAKAIADAVGLRHRQLFLGERIIGQLPDLMHQTVFLSDGAQIVNRSHLPSMYGVLDDDQGPARTILTGVSGDHLFRDHITAWGNVPYLISAEVAAMHRMGRQSPKTEFYRGLFSADIRTIEEHLEATLDFLEQEYGNFGDPEAYFRYLMYVAGPRYFGGQSAIANCYSTFRTPYWDRELVQFSMNIRLGTIGLSEELPAKDKFLESLLQASIVARNAKLAKVPYLNLPIRVFTRKSPASYHMNRVLRRIRANLFGISRRPEEDWPIWYKTVLAEEIRRLVGSDSLVKAYVNPEFIERQIANNDIHWLGKIVTVEIILRLVANGWRRPENRSH